MNPDRRLFLLINDWSRDTPWLHGVVRGFAGYGAVLFAGLLIAGWWFARGRRDPRLVAASLWAGAATLLAVALNQPIVGAVHETRPYAAIPHVLTLVHRSADPSFPSDHAVMAGAVAAGLLLVHRRLGLVAVGAALVMAASRVYVGAHYPADVLVGLLLGATVSLLGWLLLAPFLTGFVGVLQRTPLRPLLTR